jgi:hypothetical protein
MESSDDGPFAAVVSAHCGRRRSACALETRVFWLAAADWVGKSSSKINDPQSQVQSLTLIITIAWALAIRQATQALDNDRLLGVFNDLSRERESGDR